MENINILDKVLKQIEDPKIRQSLESDLPERAVFGSGGLSAFLGTQKLPPEAYGTEYTNLPDPFKKAIEEVADMDLKKIRTVKGQNALRSALLKQGIKGKDVAPFIKTVREASEVWLGKDSKEFMKTVAKVDAPSKLGHIADLLKANKQGTPKVDTLWRFVKGGLRGLGKAKMVGAGALAGAAIVKLLEQGVEEERPKVIESVVDEPVVEDAPREIKTMDDLQKALDDI